MDIEATYIYDGALMYSEAARRVLSPKAYIRLCDMPEDYEVETLVEWLRYQLATICALLYSVGGLRASLMEANSRYRILVRNTLAGTLSIGGVG